MEDVELSAVEASQAIARDFENEGDFDFMKEEERMGLIEKLVNIDLAYMDEIGEDVYDEDVIYERLYAAAEEACPRYKTYLMRFVDDYMDFMEQYLVSIGAVEWE